MASPKKRRRKKMFGDYGAIEPSADIVDEPQPAPVDPVAPVAPKTKKKKKTFFSKD